MDYLRYFERRSKREHIHIAFVTVYGCNRSILLRVTVVHLVLCPISKLNCLTGMQIGKKHCMYEGLARSSVSGIHRGAWDVLPTDKRGLLYMKCRQTLWGIKMPPHPQPGRGVDGKRLKAFKGRKCPDFFFISVVVPQVQTQVNNSQDTRITCVPFTICLEGKPGGNRFSVCSGSFGSF